MRRKSLVGFLIVTTFVLSLSTWASPVQPDGAAQDTTIVDTYWTATLLSALDWIQALFGATEDDPADTPPVPGDPQLDGGALTLQSLEWDPNNPTTEVGPTTDPDG